jgi:hypothetical protein
MKQIISASEKLTKKNIINRISDVPGGVSLLLSTLVVGSIVAEGTPLSVPVDGKRTVCKQAIILAGSSTTAVKVEAGTHHFKVGDFIGTKSNGKAYAITSITTASGVDTLNVGTAIDAVVTGAFIYQMAGVAALNTSVLLNAANVILKEGFEVPSESQVLFIADAFVKADIHNNVIGSEYLATLKGVDVIQY